MNSQKLIDYAYRAVHVTALLAKQITETYYSRPASRSYFAGCSTGGRQGLIAAQRFPDDFDGILVGAPVLDIPAINVHVAAAQRALAEAALSPAKVQHLSDVVRNKCDATDGLQDGLIDDPRRCSVDLAREVPACRPGENSASCLTSGDIQLLKVFGADITAAGRLVSPGYAVGTGILAPEPLAPNGSVAFWLGQGGQRALSLYAVESFFKHLVTPGVELDWRTFDPSREGDKLKAVSALVNATEPDLRRFRDRGGKLIMYHGWGEPQINPLLTINYRDSVRATMGQTDDFLRLFMMPGVLHCSGGVGPDTSDMMTPLIEWVESNVPPNRIVATRASGGKVTRSRPLCPYPQTAKYSGHGSIDEAQNFACVLP